MFLHCSQTAAAMEAPMWVQTSSRSRASLPARRRRIRRRPPGSPLNLEALEDRSVPGFLAPVNYAVGQSPQDVISADLNNDAVPDLAVTNFNNNSVSVLLGNGDGTFQPARNSATGTWPNLLAVGDFNSDGKLDLLTRDGPFNLSVLLGNGNGTFQLPRNTANFNGSPIVGDV